MNKIKTSALGITVISLFLTACSPSPNTTTTGQSSNSNTQTQTSSNTEVTLDQEATLAFASLYENEGIFHDSEVIASQQSSFNTKGLLGDVLSGVGNIVEKTLTGVGNIVEASLNLSADILNSLGRTDFSIKVSAVSNVKNTDGTNTKVIAIDFTNKTNMKTKTNKIAKTFLLDGNTKVDQSLTVDFDNYGKLANRNVVVSSGQKIVQSNSSSKLSSGTVIDINETRNSNNGMSGTGSVVIKSSNGTIQNYSFTSNIDVNGNLNITAKNMSNNSSFNIVQNSASQATINLGLNKSISLNTQVASETYTNIR